MPSNEPGWSFEIGDIVADRYEVCALIGQGTHGIAFEAMDKTIDDRVVLKVIHPELTGKSAGDNLFMLRRTLAYRSDELIPVQDIIEAEERVILVEPYVYAPNLRTHLQLKTDTKESFDALSGLKLVTDVAGALSWIHRFGAHGNLKPENIFVTPDGYRVHDAYSLEGIQKLSWAPDNPWTKDGYQAPEQYRGQSSPATDVYAFAIVIGEALAGKPVKDGIPLSAQSKLVSFEGFDELFLSATSRDPSERPDIDNFVSEAGKILSSAGESEAGAAPDMNITLVTGIPAISDSMMKDLEEGFSAKEALEREDERTSQEEAPSEAALPPEDGETDVDAPPLSELKAKNLDQQNDSSLIGGEPLGVDFGVIVGRAISTALTQDINVGRPKDPMAEANDGIETGLFEPSQATTVNHDDARVIFGGQVDTEGDLPVIPPSLPPMPKAPPLEDASVLEMLPDDATPSPEDEEAEVFAEVDDLPASEGGMGGLIDLDSNSDDAELVELSSDALTVEEVSPGIARKLEGQLTVEPLGEARDLVADRPGITQPPPLGGVVDPTALPTQVTRKRGVRETSWDTSPHDAKTTIMKEKAGDAAETPWYLSVAGAGLLAFSLVWFLATPSDDSNEAENAQEQISETTPADTPMEADATNSEIEPSDSSSQPIGAIAMVSDADSSTSTPPDSISTGIEATKDKKDTTDSGTEIEPTTAATDAGSPSDEALAAPDAGAAEEEVSPLANLPTPSTCREGYVEIPETGTSERFCIHILEYHGGEKRPIRKITYDDAMEKCSAESSRLCTATEFSEACGGPYPYGDRFIRKKCNVMGGFFEARPVRPGGSFPACASPYGVMDLSGNVAEWVDGALLAGGSSGQEGKSVSCARAVKRKPNRPTRTTGFRCCHDLQ